MQERIERRLVSSFLSLLILFVLGCAAYVVDPPNPPQKAVDIIYDDDCDGDYDCAVTQPNLHQWISAGYAKVWGMVSSGHSSLGAPTLRVFRDYFGHKSLFSIGAWTPGCEEKSSAPWNIAVVNTFDPGDTCANYQSCVSVLRSSVISYAKSGGKDNGLEYVITGPLSCEESFRNSPSDGISAMSGVELERRYLKQFVLMNGLAPGGQEYNCATDPQACSAFFTNVTYQNGYPPVFVVPNNTGASLVFTRVPVATLPRSNPTQVAFAAAGANLAWDEDSMAVEYAVYGGEGWIQSQNSTNIVDPISAVNAWNDVPSGQYYLRAPGPLAAFDELLTPSWQPPN